tara:strand:+ start:58 stop:693 length:636 start_codon:yes stop_codon:yes gene_type:complete
MADEEDTLKFECRGCGKTLSIPLTHEGRARCPKCGTIRSNNALIDWIREIRISDPNNRELIATSVSIMGILIIFVSAFLIVQGGLDYDNATYSEEDGFVSSYQVDSEDVGAGTYACWICCPIGIILTITGFAMGRNTASIPQLDTSNDDEAIDTDLQNTTPFLRNIRTAGITLTGSIFGVATITIFFAILAASIFFLYIMYLLLSGASLGF